MHLYRLLLIILIFFCFSCSSNVHKVGVINNDKFNSSFENLKKNEVIETLGTPSSTDPIDNSLIYFSEVRKEKNIFNKKIISRNVYILKFDENNYFSKIEFYSYDNENKLKISKKTTDTDIIKTGVLERIFGGVGRQQTVGGIPTANTGN